MHVSFSPPDISEKEIEAVAEVLRSGWITTGPKTKELERRLASYMGTPKVVCLQSQTIAAELTLRVLGIGPGDEVIVPAYTYTASASIVDHVGAKLILIDSQPNSLEMDYDALASAITERTKAIIPVDLGGVICDYERIFEIVESKESYLNLNPHFNRFWSGYCYFRRRPRTRIKAPRHSGGSVGGFSNFSFHAVKISLLPREDVRLGRPILILTMRNCIANICSFLARTVEGCPGETQKGAWEYDIVMPGYKGNMTDIMAAIGLVQLERYPQMLIKRQHIAELYNRALPNYLCKFVRSAELTLRVVTISI